MSLKPVKWGFCGIGIGLWLSSCAVPPARQQTTTPSRTPILRDAARTPDAIGPDSATGVAAEPETAAPPASVGFDTVGVHPRPTVLIVGQNQFEVRSKLVPRVMGRGWTLLVNKPDSLEFFRPADTALTMALFGAPPQPNQRIRLRFRLIKEGDGTRIALMGHLIGVDRILPAIAFEAPLADNLSVLRDDLLAAPPTLPPEKPKGRR